MELNRQPDHRWVPLLLLALSILFLGDQLTPPPGSYLGGDDVVGQLVQGLRLAIDHARAGQLPLWNPYLASGLPLWANPQIGVLYPPNWLLLVLPLGFGLSLLSALHIYLLGLGAFALARQLGRSAVASLLAAFVLSYSGFVVVRVADGHPNFVATLSWTPWLLFALQRSTRRGTMRAGLLAGVPFALMVLAGNPGGAYLIGLLVGVWTLAQVAWPIDAAHRWLPLQQLALAGMAAGVLAAGQLLPTLELIALSVRSSADYAFASQFSLPLPHLVSLLVPEFFGAPHLTGYWGEGRHTEFILYPGLVALLLLALAVRHGLHLREVRLWLAIAVVGLLLALGPLGGLHPLAFQLVPGFGLIRAPVRFAWWGLVGVALLAAWATDHVLGRPARVTVPAWLAGGPALGYVGAAVLALLAYTLAPTPDDARAYHAAAGLLRGAVVLGALTLLLLAQPRLKQGVVAALLVALVAVDLWSYGQPQLRLTSKASHTTAWDEAALLIESDGVAPPRVLTWGMFLFYQNEGMDAGLASAWAYDPLLLADYDWFAGSVADPRATTFDVLAIDYLLLKNNVAFEPDESLTALGTAGDFTLFRRERALPRAWLAPQSRSVADLGAAIGAIHAPGFDARTEALVAPGVACSGAGGEARVVAYSPNAVTVRAGGSGLLVLAEVDYPGWRVTVDGRPADLLRVNGVLRGVCLPDEGSHEVVFAFRPPLIYGGLAVSAAGLVALVLVGVLGRKR